MVLSLKFLYIFTCLYLVKSLFKSFHFPSLRTRLQRTARSRSKRRSTATCCPTRIFCETYTGFLPALCLSLFSRVRLCDPMDCSPPASSVRGILQARILEWGCHALPQGIFPTQGSNPHLSYLLHRHSYTPLPLAPPGKHSTVRKSSQGRACGC